MTILAQQLAFIFAGMALGWTMLFSFVVAPVSFKDMDQGRADRVWGACVAISAIVATAIIVGMCGVRIGVFAS